jgi:hypothetical protein
MEMGNDGNITLKSNGNIGLKGSMPKTILIGDETFIFFTDPQGYIKFLTAQLADDKVTFTEADFLASDDDQKV